MLSYLQGTKGGTERGRKKMIDNTSLSLSLSLIAMPRSCGLHKWWEKQAKFISENSFLPTAPLLYLDKCFFITDNNFFEAK